MYKEKVTRENQAQNRTNECIESALRDLTKPVDLVSNQGQLMPFDLEPGGMMDSSVAHSDEIMSDFKLDMIGQIKLY